MPSPLTLNLILIATSCLAIICCAVSFFFLRQTKKEARSCGALARQMELALADRVRELNKMNERANEQARRIAWIESRVREKSSSDALAGEDAVVQSSSKPTITERRHRVVQLSRKGIDCHTIAWMLNIPFGEVELMVNLANES